MGSLFASLLNSTGALSVFTQALQVVSNDVTNASTPGYVKQTQTFEALPFDPSIGLPGGVALGPVQNARNAFSENSVRQQQSGLGLAQQKTADLSRLDSLFDVSGKAGIAASINRLFQSFSQLSINPNDPTARQNVLTQANQVAQSFQQTTGAVLNASTQARTEAGTTIDTINHLASVIADINSRHPLDYKGNMDAGVDAKLNSTLEELSKYVNITALQQPDGSVTVYAGGQTPLVVGNRTLPIQGDFSSGFKVLDSEGQDISTQMNQGQLAGVMDVLNSKLPSYLADLNTLAKSLADGVNTALSQGIDLNGAAPTANLFNYNPNAAGQTLTANASLTPAQIAAALPGAPGGNGNALNISALETAKSVNGYTFAQFYGTLGARVGQDIADAQSDQDTQTQLLSQAQALRSQISSVSLDEEAEKLVQFQRSYQATAKLISVLDELSSAAVNLIKT